MTRLVEQIPLPDNIEWLKLFDGQRWFPVYGASGGLVNDAIGYLVQKGPQVGAHHAIDLGLPENGKLFTVRPYAENRKYAAIWGSCDPHSFQACLNELNS